MTQPHSVLPFIDVYSRYVVGWNLSNTMTAEWSCSVIETAIATHGKPKIINSDQGSQFTSTGYINLLKNNGIQNSMNGRGRALDDIFIERFWRSMKQEYVYPNPCGTGEELWEGMNRYLDFLHDLVVRLHHRKRFVGLNHHIEWLHLLICYA